MHPELISEGTKGGVKEQSGELDMFSKDVMMLGQGADANQYLFTQSNTGLSGTQKNVSSFDMTAVLLEDYKGFMKDKVQQH